MFSRWLFFLLLIIPFGGMAQSGGEVLTLFPTQKIVLFPYLTYSTDTALFSQSTIQWANSDFHPISQEETKVLYNRQNSRHLVRLRVFNPGSSGQSMLLFYKGSVVDAVVSDRRGNWSLLGRTGINVPLQDRVLGDIFGQTPYIPLYVPSGDTTDVYLKIENLDLSGLASQLNIDPYLSTWENTTKEYRNEERYNFGLLAILLAITLYHFVIFSVLKEKIYIYFSLYACAMFVLVLYFKGYLLEWLFADGKHLFFHNVYLFDIIRVGYTVPLIIFIRSYLQLSKNLPVWDRYFKMLIGVHVGLLVASWVIGPGKPWLVKAEFWFLIFSLTSYFLVGIHSVSKSISGSWLYLIGNSAFFFGAISNIWFHVLNQHMTEVDWGDIGLGIQQFMLAVGIAWRIRTLSEERTVAQHALIIQLEENQRIQERANAELERKVQERTQEIALQNEKLEALNQEKDALMSIVAHDLKAPLNNIESLLKLIAPKEAQHQPDAELMSLFHRSIRQGRDLIGEMLEVQRLESSKDGIQLGNIRLSEWLMELCRPYQEQADQKGVQFNLSAGSLGSPLVVLPLDMLRRVLENLVSNAIKFSPSGTTVQVKAKQSDQFVYFEVEDEGPGFKENEIPLIFKKFQRLSARPTQGESSTGLGLYIVKMLVDRMQGQIELETAPGKGARFLVKVPLLYAQAAKPIAEPNA